jgi:YNFM family putative membrane transporter
VAGILLTLVAPLWLVVSGVGVMVVGFFAAHGTASGWVAARASAGTGGAGQAASLYLLAYYAGASTAGAAAGWAWSTGGWPRVVALAATLAGVALVVALALTRTRRLTPPAATAPDPA